MCYFIDISNSNENNIGPPSFLKLVNKHIVSRLSTSVLEQKIRTGNIKKNTCMHMNNAYTEYILETLK